jgi:steroid delta-isomerase-like uncharacterized protein
MNEIATKPELIESLATTRTQLHAFLASLTPEQLSEPRDLAGWAIKDHLAHLAVWRDGITALLQYRSRWEAMGLTTEWADRSDEEINAALFERYKDQSVPEILALLDTSYERFAAVLERLSDADLNQTYSHYQPDEPGEDSGAPILNWVAGNTTHHVLEHLPWMQQIVSPNLALVLRWAGAWSRADLDEIEAIFAEDYAVNGQRIGRDGVKHAVRSLHAAFAPASLVLDDVVTSGDRIAVRWTLRGTHSGEFMGVAPTNRPVELSGINIYRIAGGRIAENHEQVGMDALLRQLRAD